ncbi:9596_t:CDS:2 [Funneliformis mosseae]|uniref:9596_t:CDS:1 n=1 Tax=Funneliformis mosseae TaxID=27381 RepID=A0A9N9FSW9_FUNMO|nr:9596_t:CDS:2 [Funneliformis mosseae]
MHENETQFVSDNNCSYCYVPFFEELWCNKCDPSRIIEGWTSGHSDIDKFIKETIYKARNKEYSLRFLEWVPLDRFIDIKEIGEGAFSKVYSATWIVGKSKFEKQDDGSWKKSDPEPMKEGFEEADKAIPNISISRKTNPDAIYTSRAFTFKI